jgi:hypothetical protein
MGLIFEEIDVAKLELNIRKKQKESKKEVKKKLLVTQKNLDSKKINLIFEADENQLKLQNIDLNKIIEKEKEEAKKKKYYSNIKNLEKNSSKIKKINKIKNSRKGKTNNNTKKGVNEEGEFKSLNKKNQHIKIFQSKYKKK